MTVEQLMEFLQTLPKDTVIVNEYYNTLYEETEYREVGFEYKQNIDNEGNVIKKLIVK